jgi:hypothetical protein
VYQLTNQSIALFGIAQRGGGLRRAKRQILEESGGRIDRYSCCVVTGDDHTRLSARSVRSCSALSSFHSQFVSQPICPTTSHSRVPPECELVRYSVTRTEGSVAVVLALPPPGSLHYISAPCNRPLPSAITCHVEIAPIALSIARVVLLLARFIAAALKSKSSPERDKTSPLARKAPLQPPRPVLPLSPAHST